MKHDWIKCTIILVTLSCAVFLIRCYTYKMSAEDVNDHVGNFPPGEVYPIDGIWKDAWGNRFELKAGRMVALDVGYPQVNYYDILREAAGKYRAKSPHAETNYTISVVAEERIIIRESSYDQVLTSIELFDPKKFKEEVSIVLEEARRPKIVIHGLECRPRKMKPSSPFRLECTFTLRRGDVSYDSLSASLAYQIRDAERILFMSKPRSFLAPNMDLYQRVVNLKASEREGAYQIHLKLNSGSLQASDSCEFLIDRNAHYPDDRPFIDRLAGKYRIEGKEESGIILLSKKGNQIVPAFILPETIPLDKIRYECKVVFFSQDRLVLLQTVLTYVDEYNVFNPSMTAEITIDLSDPLLEELPTSTKILSSNFLGTGTTFRGIMLRVEE